MKIDRQAALKKLIDDGKVDSMQSAVSLLNQNGYNVTELVVHCDLEDLGAVLIRDGANVRYATVVDGSREGASFLQVMRDYVTSRRASGNMIVLKTPPGHANVVAAALDRGVIEGVLGIVAGDDTVFICVDEGLGAETVLKVIEKLESDYSR
ncbi:MAG: hypothetical protein KDD66_09275 [Bdellovibrionales bacterium]|nr:hypothetical protein [Bdellovibrionales bacterium]